MTVPDANGIARLFQAQPGPSPVLTAATAIAALLVVTSGGPWRFSRNVITIVHEAGHALVAVLVGRRLQGIRLHSDTSGLTLSRGKPEGPGMVLTAMAGYPAPALLGLAFAGLLSANHMSGLLVLAALLLLGVLIMVRNAYGVFTVVLSAAVLVLIALFAPPLVQSIFVYLITWFLLIGALRPLVELQSKRRRGAARGSDVDQLGRLTGLPIPLWLLILVVLEGGCLILGVVLSLAPVLPA